MFYLHYNIYTFSLQLDQRTAILVIRQFVYAELRLFVVLTHTDVNVPQTVFRLELPAVIIILLLKLSHQFIS